MNPPEIPPPFDDQPPAVPDAPTPIKESASAAMLGMALNARAALLRSLDRVKHRSAHPVTDATGRSFLVLATANAPISQMVETIVPGAPFSVSVFNDADGNDRWLAAPASVLANDGEFWFTPFQPTLFGTPLSLFTEDTAPTLPAGGVKVWLRIAWEIDDTRPLVPDEPIYAVRVTSVEAQVQGYADDPPADDFNAGVTYRPWFWIGPAVDGVRPVDYQTLGYCHFWLFVKMLVDEPPPSESSGDSSDSSSPPAFQACFPMRLAGKMRFPTWGMVLFPLPAFRMTMRVTLKRRSHHLQVPLPAEWIGSVRPNTTWVVCASTDRHGASPVLCQLYGHDVHVNSMAAENFPRRLTIQLSGLLADGPTDLQFTDDKGREHNRKFWSSTP